jgi:hypothetical protein
LGASGNVSEPNGNGKGSPIELCAFANFTEAYGCEGDMMGELGTAFGWADTVCSRRYVSICRIMREWPGWGRRGIVWRVCLADATICCQSSAGTARAHRCACAAVKDHLTKGSSKCCVALAATLYATIEPVTSQRRWKAYAPDAPLPANTPRWVPTHVCLTPTAAYQVFPYTSKSFNNTYKFNNEPMLQQNAEETCKCQGGHLVSYISPGEQSEVERYMIDQVRACAAAALLPPARVARIVACAL